MQSRARARPLVLPIRLLIYSPVFIKGIDTVTFEDTN
jgi:hypothetical protein